MNKDITNYNSKGEWHGYQERYWDKECNTLWYRTNYKNGSLIGYEEYHLIKQTRYYIT